MAARVTCKDMWTAVLICVATPLFLHAATVPAGQPRQFIRRGLQGTDEEPYRNLDPPFTACSAHRSPCCRRPALPVQAQHSLSQLRVICAGVYPPRALVRLAIVACMLWLLRAAPLC